MPIYKMDGKKDGLQKYRVRINYVDREGKNKQLDRVAYGREAAKDLERQLTFDFKMGEATTSRLTVQQLSDEYLSVMSRELRETTMSDKKGKFKRYILPELGSVSISKLTARRLQEWKLFVDGYTTDKGDTIKCDSKRAVYKELNALLNYAVRMEYIVKNPLKNVGNFKDAYEHKEEMSFYTAAEFKKFIAAARSRAEQSTNSINEWNYYVFFNIAFYGGLRKGEIYALKWTDLKDDVLYIRRSISQKLKGEDRETPPKTKSSVRDIQIPIPLTKVLQEHKERCKKLGEYSEDWRICGGQTCIRDSTVSRRNDEYSKAAGLKHIRIHDFRHSHVSILANAGINIHEVSRRMGHENVEETWNTYCHMYPKEAERAIKALNNV